MSAAMPVDPVEAEERLLSVLSSIERPGSFCTQGALPSPLFRLDVAGVGTLAFPLLAQQAEQLVSVAERAPYGRGPDTLVDTGVRKVWQIGADRVSLPDETWAETLSQIVQRAQDGLGAGGHPVEARLYKLLVYDAGSFFVEHRDTEKEPGMFATLIVVLPSLFRGGELVVRHLGEEEVLPLQSKSLAELPFAAFYADCKHELRPVIEGWRIALVYNLVRPRGSGLPLQAPDHRDAVATISSVLSDWVQHGEDWPRKIVIPLEHQYTLEGLSFAGLKNADRGAASALIEAGRRAGCAVHLAMISITESGSAEGVYQGYRRHYDDEGDEEDEDYEIVEVHEREELLVSWRDAQDQPAALPALPLEEGELWPDGALEEDEPDEESFHEATGNEGGSFERTYRRAALVLWPEVRELEVLIGAGPDAVLPSLEQRAADAAPGSPLREQVLEGAELVVAEWSSGGHGSGGAEVRHRMAQLLVRLSALDLLESFVQGPLTSRYQEQDHDALILAGRALGEERAGPALANVIAAHMIRAPKSCVLLLGRVANELGAPSALPPARAAVDGLSPEALAAVPAWQHGRIEPTTLASLLKTLWELGDAALAERTVASALQRFGVDTMLVPVAVALAADAQDHAGWAALRGAVVAHLQARASEPLEAPSDLARPASWDCKCEPCRAVRAFLADPQKETLSLKAVQHVRDHVASQLGHVGADVDLQTIKKGSPHTLLCTKNQKSYERRVAVRKSDLAALRALGAPGTPAPPDVRR
jgi:hypothetical protein